LQLVDAKTIGTFLSLKFQGKSNNSSHDVYDVTCGSILGMGIAYFSYRRYYPRLRSPKCDEPFPSRETLFNEGFGKLKSDEETGRVGVTRDSLLEDDEEEE